MKLSGARCALLRFPGILTILLIAVVDLSAQFNPLDFEKLSAVPPSPVSGIKQDSRGFLWIATSTGLFRYDGISTKTYHPDGTLHSLPDDRITQLECIDDRIIALTERGVFIHDCRTAQDTSIFLTGLPNVPRFVVNKISHACADHDGGLLILSTAGLLHLDAQNRKLFEYIHPDSAETPPVSGTFGRVVFPMPQGQFIITGSSGWHLYDPEKKTIRRLTPDLYPGFNPFLHDGSVKVVELAPLEYLILSRYQQSITYYHVHSGTSYTIGLDSTTGDLLRWNTGVHSITDSLFYILKPGKNIKTLKLDRTKNTMTLESQADTAMMPSTLLIDRDERVWIGTHHGVYQQRSITHGIRKSVPAFDAKVPERAHVQFAISGPYLVTGTAEGMEIKCYDKITLQLVKTVPLPSLRDGHPTSIAHFTPYGKDSLLICTTNGPRYFLNLNTWVPHRIDPSPVGVNVFSWYAFQSTRDGTLYTLGNGSNLERFDAHEKKFVAMPFAYEKARLMDIATQVAEDLEGNLILSHRGFCRYDKGTSTIDFCRTDFGDTRLDINNTAFFIMDTLHAAWWFALQHTGLIRYDPASDSMKRFTPAEGLPDQTIYGMCLVKDHVWLVTPSGLGCISTEDYTIRSFPYGFGSSLHSNKKALTYDPESNQLYFMEDQTIMACQPEALLYTSHPMQVYVEQISCGDEVWHWPADQAIAIHGKDRKVRIQLAGVSFDKTAPLQYSLRYLSGRDTLWNTMGVDGVAYVENLKPGKYTIQFRLASSGNDIAPVFREVRIHIFPLWYERWYFKSMVALLCLYLIWRLARWQVQRKKEKQNVSRQLAELELQALRARMNPHFIFNCLNSINRYILKAESEMASYYLSRFAKLIRHILDYSTESSVSLNEELQVSQLYIELESLRLNHGIVPEFEIAADIDKEHLRVPPLFIQPYIENAIWHGLAPKKGDLQLWIRARQESGRYVFEIEDNGVGLTASAQNKKQGHHASKGLQLARETFERYGQVAHMRTEVKIMEMKTSAGNIQGTKVVLTLIPAGNPS